MRIRTIFLLIFLIASSCEKEEPIIKNEFRVIVESTSDLACYLPIIRFLDKEAQVKERTNLETLTYNALKLEKAFNVAGNILIVEFTQVADPDIRVCNTFGIPFPGVSIVKARLAE